MSESKLLKVGILLGGNSSERKISLRSGRAVKKALQNTGFRTLTVDPRNPSLCERRLGQIDVAFIALHGQGGEDGVIQRRLERRHIPYIGSAPSASLDAFQKDRAKRIFQKKGIPTPPWVILRPATWRTALGRLKGPLFMKPLKEGSSIGAFAVEDSRKMAEKIRRAIRRYGSLLAEKKIQGREYTVGILADRALPVIEVKPKRRFYDYRAKYTKGSTQYQVPAKIRPQEARRLQRIALRAHRALGLRDVSRVDLMVDAKGRPYVLEANSIPGMTELSLLPKAARAAGMTFEQVCRTLIGRALGRNGRQQGSSNGKKEA